MLIESNLLLILDSLTRSVRMIYVRPNDAGSIAKYKFRYDNFINGEWVAPCKSEYFTNVTPITGDVFCEVPRSTSEDIELALDAAHKAKDNWGKSSPAYRAHLLNKIADRLEQNLEMLAVCESFDNGKPIREALAADIPLAIDHFRYFAGCIRSQEGRISDLDEHTVAYHFHEPLGVIGQIIPWNFPILMAAWKIAPALAAGNCVVLKPAEQTPWSMLIVAELIQDLLPPGVLNIVNGYGEEAGKALAQNKHVAKIAFTGESATGQLILKYASDNLIPVTLELGGKSPNIFFADILNRRDDFYNKCLEGFTMFVLNQGEVCTCPSRALVETKMYADFLPHTILRAKNCKQGNPLDTDTMIGAQVSIEQIKKITKYVDIGRQEGANILLGGKHAKFSGDLKNGFYFEPTILEGHNKMRVFQEEIFGPVLSVTTFNDEQDAITMANDTRYGLGAGLWTRDIHKAYRLGRQIKAGRVWTNCYHLYPAHAAFGGYKQSGIGRENHKMMLEHYQQTKNLLVSYDEKPMGFF